MPATVLIVDDEPGITAMLHDILESRGYRVLFATTPQAALALLADDHGPIDLLLVDVIMPQMPGRDLATAVQARWPDSRVIFMSGYSAERLPPPGVPDGAQIVMKPIAIAALVDAVRIALGPSDIDAT